MTERGTLILEEMTYLPCSCPTCNSTTKTDLVLMERRERVSKLSLHNLYLLRQDVLRCKEAISEGRLWDLVEERAAAHPRVMTAFVEMAKNSEWLAGGTPFLKERGLLMRSEVDASRPELAMARDHLGPIMKRRATGAILVVPESDGPLSRSALYQKALRMMKRSPGRDVYKVHRQLGAFPAELEFVYPFTQTVSDGEVTRKQVRDAVSQLRKMGYESVTVCEKRRAEGAKTRD